jgi:hypothetical protein
MGHILKNIQCLKVLNIGNYYGLTIGIITEREKN